MGMEGSQLIWVVAPVFLRSYRIKMSETAVKWANMHKHWRWTYLFVYWRILPSCFDDGCAACTAMTMHVFMKNWCSIDPTTSLQLGESLDMFRPPISGKMVDGFLVKWVMVFNLALPQQSSTYQSSLSDPSSDLRCIIYVPSMNR